MQNPNILHQTVTYLLHTHKFQGLHLLIVQKEVSALNARQSWIEILGQIKTSENPGSWPQHCS